MLPLVEAITMEPEDELERKASCEDARVVVMILGSRNLER